jgi:SAM-dependent methyltransferase
MSDDETPPLDVAAFYDAYGEREWERLDRDLHHRLEWDATTTYLDRQLPDAGRVLDVGGGAGRYAVWLAEAGLVVETLAALEGPFSQRRGDLDALTDAHRSAIRETLAELREDRCVVDHSAHMLAVCRA